MSVPESFTCHVPDEAIADLKQRLARTRLPDQAPGEPWSLGTEVDYLAGLIAYWRDGFDWRRQEAALNAFPQIRLRLGEVDLHALHVPGKGPSPRPLLLCHGWPGSVFEFLDIIPRLTDPARFGGDPAQSFTVVAPSLPGYGLSFRPGQTRFGVEEIADTVADLMAALGYDRYFVQGGDWGAFVGTRLAHRYPGRVRGLHLNMLPLRRDGTAAEDATPEERAHFDRLALWLKEEIGYQWIQGTKPQTLAFALTDSPAGLAAWIVEKFRSWSDCGGTIESAIDRDRMLGNIALYWFTGAIGSSFYPYYARMHRGWPIPDGGTIDVPTAHAAFPAEMVRPPRSLAEKVFTDIRRWTVMPKGGHFAALEQPELLAQDLTAFAAEL
ncbi:epoxide hydrolase family protein [Methylobacterium oryzihabitans]|uniref:Epoxide hydrolase n=1 Tax=Methylobacterium oryzihabitans TaxID=2499852 RepID=A0A437P6G2_9HYPH|nr:epoxide hydrolase family protein [Methylobacterium oryzihabitans]RVU17792.1 epoxide hydrolase [Methylobacterium oryzihabitans]